MPPETPPYQSVRVLDAWDETPALRALRLALPEPLAAAHRRPGQTVRVRTDAGDAYLAIASAPSEDGRIELLVKRGGRAADAALAAADRGALELSAPLGAGFPLEERPDRDLLLFAAGSGIAPLRALIQHLTAHRDRHGRVTLFYGQRRGADFAYAREHLGWERSGVRVILCPSAEPGWPGPRGRVQEVAASIGFAGTAPAGAVAFACGMAAMIDDVRAALARAGLPPTRVHTNF